jgi:flagellar biosynthesis protein FlhA
VAILVTRISRSQDMSQQLTAQVFGHPRVLSVTAAVMALIGFIPGMPNLVFLLLAAACGGIAWIRRRRKAESVNQPAPAAPAAAPQELSWDDVTPQDALGLEVGYRLIPLVDVRQGGELMARIKGVRKKLTTELGFLVQPVHIRDNLELPPNAYRVLLHGVPLVSAQIHPERDLALNSGRVYGTLNGIPGKDPAFGLDAVWIERGARDHAQTLGYTVVDASTVVATHLSQLIKDHAAELLGHDEAQQLLNALAKSAPKLVEDLVPKLLPLSTLVRVLRILLADRVPIRNLRGIAEALAEAAPRSQDPVALASAVRVALRRQIVQDIGGAEAELPVLTLSPGLERVLQDSVASGAAAFEPGLAERMQQSIVQGAQRQAKSGQPAVLLVPSSLRPLLARFTRQSVPDLHVLAYDEVPDDRRIRMVGAIA